MSLTLTSDPNSAIGIERIREAEELFAQGYHFAAGVCARSAIEIVTYARLSPTLERRGHKTFKKVVAHLHRGCSINSRQRKAIADLYYRLSEYAHGVPLEASRLERLIAAACELRQLIATAQSRN